MQNLQDHLILEEKRILCQNKTKHGFLKKCNKSDLPNVVRTQQIQESEFIPAPKQRFAIIDIMAEARKIESWRKKGKVKTFSDVE